MFRICISFRYAYVFCQSCISRIYYIYLLYIVRARGAVGCLRRVARGSPRDCLFFTTMLFNYILFLRTHFVM